MYLIRHKIEPTNVTIRSFSKKNWSDINKQKTFLEKLAKKLRITSPTEWYSVTPQQIIRNGGSELLAKYNDSPMKLLRTIYPQYPVRCCIIT